jgi:hypothetical protein
MLISRYNAILFLKFYVVLKDKNGLKQTTADKNYISLKALKLLIKSRKVKNLKTLKNRQKNL